MLFSNSVRVKIGFSVWLVIYFSHFLYYFPLSLSTSLYISHVLLFAARNGIKMRLRTCANCKRTCENPHPHCGPCTAGCGCPTNAPISHEGRCITLQMCRGLSHITTVMGMRTRPAKRCDPEIMTNWCLSLSNDSFPTSPLSCVNIGLISLPFPAKTALLQS